MSARYYKNSSQKGLKMNSYIVCAINGFLVALVTYWITGKIMPGGSMVAGFYVPFLTNGAWYTPFIGIAFGLIGFLNFWGFMR